MPNSKVLLKNVPTGIDDTIEFSFFDEDKNENIGKIEYDINNRSKKAKINQTYIIPERRHEGILTSLIDDIICNIQCEGMKKVQLHTVNDIATKAWEKQGFEITGTEKDISGTIITYMEKELTGKCNCKQK